MHLSPLEYLRHILDDSEHLRFHQCGSFNDEYEDNSKEET
jgi:hypothetical protein